MRGLALVSPRDINDESFHLFTGLNIFGQQRHHVEKKDEEVSSHVKVLMW